MNQNIQVNITDMKKKAESDIRNILNEDLFKVCPPARLLDIKRAGWILLAEGIGTVLLNMTIIFLIGRLKKKSNMAFLILNLAISDLSVALFNDLPVMAQSLYSWEAGDELCKCSQITRQMTLFASTYLLVSLSIDRLVAIKTPLSTTRRTKKYKFFMVALPWALAFVFSLPHLNSQVVERCGNVEYSVKAWCIVDKRNVDGKIIIILTTLLLVVIPAVLLISIYGYIFLLVRQRSSSDYRADSDHSATLRSNQSVSLQMAKTRSLAITLAVGFVFMICWMPSTIAVYIIAESPELELKGSYYTLISLAPLNSLANPIIVLVFNYKMFKRKSPTPSLSTKLTLTTSLRDSGKRVGGDVNFKSGPVEDNCTG